MNITNSEEYRPIFADGGVSGVRHHLQDSVSAVVAALAVSPPRALALEPSDTSALQEIVVTARKRQENLCRMYP